MFCKLCGSLEYTQRAGSVRDNPAIKIYECSSCSLVYLSTTEHIDKNFYEDSEMSVGFSITQWIKETQIDDTRRFEFTKNMIVNKKVVDFGSGAGGYLLQAREVASSVIGVELDKKVQQHYLENSIDYTQNIESLTDSYYDVITAFHVVEHIVEPLDVLDLLVSKLKVGGKLIIEVPNSNDALLSVYESEAFANFTYWSPHIYLYNAKTLNMLMSKVQNTKIEFIKHIQRYSLSNHMYWLAKNKPGGHQQWGSFLDSSELNVAYEAQLASIQATDTLIMQLIKTQ